MHKETQKQDIRRLTQEQLTGFFRSSGMKPFKGKQVWEWLWKKYVLDFDHMTNISLKERELLRENFLVTPAKINEYNIGKDKTIKVSFYLTDGQLVEGVLIPDKERVTACISSQVGCAYRCSFCATGRMGLKRNMECAEIFDQVLLLSRLSRENYNTGLSNIVLMGMGEPLENYDNVIGAINILCNEKAQAISPSRITLSTVGIIEGVNKLAQDKVKFNLAVSLHTANNEKRNQLMPVNRKNSLPELAEALKNFYQATNNRITIEYLLIEDFNDSPADAIALAKYCKQFPVKINIIEFNPVENTSFKRPSPKKTGEFINTLEKFNLVVNIRRSRGSDVDAACGQLATKKAFD